MKLNIIALKCVIRYTVMLGGVTDELLKGYTLVVS